MNGILITVRTDSSRLPQKALLKIHGKTTIEILIERIKRSRKTNKIVLCTTSRPIDDELCKIAKKHNIEHYRGSVEDKLVRWLGACEEHKIDFFVTADGDDLLCEPYLIDKAFEQYEKDKSIDFIKSDGIICGAFTYGIKASALFKVCEIKDSSNTEMMWVYFTETGLFNVRQLENIDQKFYRDDIRMTLDYEEDLDFFKSVIEHFRVVGKDYPNLEEIVDLLNDRPEISKINIHKQNEWKKNQDKHTKLVLRK
jgi:spore coat polysaccharide biosynthesis protein SpsF